MSDIVRFSNAPPVFASANRLFNEVSRKLAQVIPAAEIYHVGSTAIPGTLTKGDLDILVRVSAGDFRMADEVLERMFRRNAGSFRSEVFAAFLDHSTEPDLAFSLSYATVKPTFFWHGGSVWKMILSLDGDTMI